MYWVLVFLWTLHATKHVHQTLTILQHVSAYQRVPSSVSPLSSHHSALKWSGLKLLFWIFKRFKPNHQTLTILQHVSAYQRVPSSVSPLSSHHSALKWSGLKLLFWIFKRFKPNFNVTVSVWPFFLLTHYTTDHFESAMMAAERSPWRWHPVICRNILQICWHLMNIFCVCIFGYTI